MKTNRLQAPLWPQAVATSVALPHQRCVFTPNIGRPHTVGQASGPGKNLTGLQSILRFKDSRALGPVTRALLASAWLLAAPWCGALPSSGPGAGSLQGTVSYSGGGLQITDGSKAGVASSQSFSTGFDSIDHVSVSLDITGTTQGPGWNGDLYGYLLHDGLMVLLLDQPGLSSANPFGYGDSGMHVVLDDHAPANIQNYQRGLPSANFAGGLTGTWAPDGAQNGAGLSRFDGLDPNGTWTLFLADLSTGNINQLSSWSLNIDATIAPIPDCAATAFLLLAGLALVAMLRGLHQARAPHSNRPRPLV